MLDIPSTITVGERSEHITHCCKNPAVQIADVGMHAHAKTGGEARPKGRDRIEHLAHMRNLAAAPTIGGQDGSAPRWPAQRLVFINDVYFCARDVLRLLQHESADLACAMDFLAYKGPPSTADVHPWGVDGPPLSVCIIILCSVHALLCRRLHA
jgi:hypothetical protein